ncbi:hypothetical protein [Rhizobium sp. AB2/73]|uniref:hypothetical protein n=1 Tax=Rhizobium sp. AB2/73 TaxID=2795216 RepID=UPI000DDD4334|nr:hypothetical protein [Rhizobium sp. AB2/73]QYA17497.1 hypothetical protein J5284_34100 [Rhizobium sp. AB2/73]UEQ85818.1 hypothetical protein I8E17_34080 [Rhizobium sp. AB2/73]
MRWILIFAAASMTLAPWAQRQALASEWGCEVLLCAASDNPSWHSIATCSPPMNKLISAMKRPGFSWPTCPEGGSGKPGYERYADCPSGWNPAQAENDGDRGGGSDLSRCSRVVNACGQGRLNHLGASPQPADGVTRVYSGEHSSCTYTEFMARPLRDKPYYFDIRDDTTKTTSRYFFDLQK